MFDVGQKTWKSYDWSQITTVAVFGKYDSELMCYAHSKGARVVLKGTVFSGPCLANAKMCVLFSIVLFMTLFKTYLAVDTIKSIPQIQIF